MPPIEMPEMMKKYSGILTSGIVVEMAPHILKGAVVELLIARKVDVAKATKWVNSNESLWGTVEPEYQERLRRLGNKAGDLGWLDADWVINAIKKDLPTLASLFLGWRKGYNWLGRQVEQIKTEIRQA